MMPVGGINKLCRDTNPIPLFPNAALKYVTNAEVFCHLLDLHGLTFVSKHGVTRNHEKAGHLSEPVNDLLRQTVTEDLLLRVVTQVGKGKYCDGEVVGYRHQRPTGDSVWYKQLIAQPF